ncbi:unconventional myosin-XV-like [Choloepus didactylus]|uniref:unconventional myosin-XV-like n=1 Tax=Choloepus didactylus TaxID=27675 RepID=UPI00189C83E6|nr:unconventional myosin-XV-like [Choloepus didactylus]
MRGKEEGELGAPDRASYSPAPRHHGACSPPRGAGDGRWSERGQHSLPARLKWGRGNQIWPKRRQCPDASLAALLPGAATSPQRSPDVLLFPPPRPEIRPWRGRGLREQSLGSGIRAWVISGYSPGQPGDGVGIRVNHPPAKPRSTRRQPEVGVGEEGLSLEGQPTPAAGDTRPTSPSLRPERSGCHVLETRPHSRETKTAKRPGCQEPPRHLINEIP